MKTQLVVVTDKERGITNAIEKVAKNVIVHHCWNHIKQDFKFWLGKRSISGKEKNIYASDLEAILESENIIEFEQKCEELLCKWSKVAVDYFNNFLKSDILQYSNRWRLTELPQEKYTLVYCKVQPQNKGDCGVHAIANIVEYCINSFNGQTDVQFKKEDLRKHLHDCLENKFFEPFPKKRSLKCKAHIRAQKTEIFHMDCDCRYPDCFETMVQCDNKMCKNGWYHIKCSGYSGAANSDESWLCSKCKE